MADVVERLAGIEATQKSQGETLGEIKGYFQRSAQERTTQHMETVTRLAVIESTMKNYQTICDKDREGLNERVDGMEKSQSYMQGKSTALAGAISLLITGVGLGIEWFKK